MPPISPCEGGEVGLVARGWCGATGWSARLTGQVRWDNVAPIYRAPVLRETLAEVPGWDSLPEVNHFSPG